MLYTSNPKIKTVDIRFQWESIMIKGNISDEFDVREKRVRQPY